MPCGAGSENSEAENRRLSDLNGSGHTLPCRKTGKISLIAFLLALEENTRYRNPAFLS